MILSISHIFPVIVDQMVVYLEQAEHTEKPPHPAFSISNSPVRPVFSNSSPKPSTFQYFMPLMAFEKVEESQQKSVVKLDWKVDRIDFSPGSAPITVMLYPEPAKVPLERGAEIQISPGSACIFGEGKACVYSFMTSQGGKVLFASIHSGVGGEADTLRDLIEGTGVNQGLLDIYDVVEKMESLQGSEIALRQGDETISGMELVDLVRISPANLATYMALPVEKTLDYAVQIAGLDPDLLGQDLLVMETCGWRLPGEDNYNLENTSSSIYLAVIEMPD